MTLIQVISQVKKIEALRTMVYIQICPISSSGLLPPWHLPLVTWSWSWLRFQLSAELQESHFSSVGLSFAICRMKTSSWMVAWGTLKAVFLLPTAQIHHSTGTLCRVTTHSFWVHCKRRVRTFYFQKSYSS